MPADGDNYSIMKGNADIWTTCGPVVRVLAFSSLVTMSGAPPVSTATAAQLETEVKAKKDKKDGAKKKGVKPEEKSTDKILVWLRVGKVTDEGVVVTVQWGQRLQDIADAYGTGISKLEQANPGLSSGSIKVGDKILVPGATKVLAVKTWVPADKIDEIPGMGPTEDPAHAQVKDDKKSDGKKSDDGTVLVKSGKVVKSGVKHTIQPGQTLTDVASAYGVSVNQIVKATGLDNPDSIKIGQKVLVPGATAVVAVKAKPKQGQDLAEPNLVKSGKVVKAGVLHVVQPGQTLAVIASAYDIKVSSVLKANGLTNANAIKQGSKLLIPGAKAVVAVKADPGKSLAVASKITFHRIHTGETKTLTLFNSKGKLVPDEYKKLEKLMFDNHTGKTHKIHPRLCFLLKLVSEKYPGKVITIYSGFRAYDPKQYTKKSKHNVGQAIDFAVDGVSNLSLMKYLKTLADVGVGYYPNSYFVHMDVRETSAFWVDYSKPGEAPKYKKWKKGDTSKAVDENDVNLEADSDSSQVDVQ